MKVKFVNVGREHKTWEAETSWPHFEWLENEVKVRGALRSNEIEFTDERLNGDDGTFDGAFGSVIVGGFRPVGRYYIGKAIPQDITESAQTIAYT